MNILCHLLDTHDDNFNDIIQVGIAKDLANFVVTLDEICASISWLEDSGQTLIRNTYKKLTFQVFVVYPPKGILVLFYRILNLFQRHLGDSDNMMYDDTHVTYSLEFLDEPTSFDSPREERPAVKAKGTVRPSERPITLPAHSIRISKQATMAVAGTYTSRTTSGS